MQTTTKRPFSPAADPDRFVALEPHEAARQRLLQCINRFEGAGLLIGPSGSGKTLVIRSLEKLLADRFSIAMIANTATRTRKALLQAILYRVGLPYRDKDEGELRLSLIDFVQDRERSREGLLLLIDDAEALPGRVLEELRMLTNLCDQGKPRVVLILAGNPLLEERLGQSEYTALQQRIVARSYLSAMSYDQTLDYVSTQLEVCGADFETLFTAEAIKSVWEHSEGIPRVVNQLCDHGLLLGAAAGVTPLDAAAIDESWADLQQLPPPRQDVAGDPPASIEFGTLDDEDEESGDGDTLFREADLAEPLSSQPEEGVDEPIVAQFPNPESAPTPTADDDSAPAEADLHLDTSNSEADEFEGSPDNGPIAQLDAIQRQLDDAANELPEEEIVVDPYGEHHTVVVSAPTMHLSRACDAGEIEPIQPVPLIGPDTESPEFATDYSGDPVFPPSDEEAADETAAEKPCTVPLQVESRAASEENAEEKAPHDRSRSMGNLFSRLRRM